MNVADVLGAALVALGGLLVAFTFTEEKPSWCGLPVIGSLCSLGFGFENTVVWVFAGLLIILGAVMIVA